MKPELNPLISVVLPSFNRADTLPRAIDSVLNQSYRNLELIVVDDASTDGTQDLLLGISDNRVKSIVLEHNSGGSRARNHGVHMAQGNYIAFQDSDDEWCSEKLLIQMEKLREDQNAVACFCPFVRELSGTKRTFGVTGSHGDVDLVSRLLAGNFIGTPTLILKREIFWSVGGFDDTLPRYQDWDLVLRLALQGNEFCCTREELVRVYNAPNSISTDPMSEIEAIGRILRKHSSAFYGEPRALAKWEHILARRYIEIGNMDLGFKYSSHAWQKDKRTLKYGAIAALSCLRNKTFFDLVFRTARAFKDGERDR